jgi:outer membrane protein assembly factor BamA
MWIDCNVTLSSHSFQSYQFEVEGTTSSGPGLASRFVYQHKNIFGGAELLNLRLKAATEALKKSTENTYTNTLEIGAEVGLQVPKFMLPFKNEQFIKKYNPRTQLSSSYHYLRRPDYTHTVANITFGYLWKKSTNSSYIVNPFDINVVKLLSATEVFTKQIENSFLRYSFSNQLVAVSSYVYTYNNNSKRNTSSFYFRFNAESAGNTLRLLNEFAQTQKSADGVYHILGIQFAQFVKSDIDFHYYMPMTESDKIAFRFILGAALPYNNSKAIPFVKQFFAGGANSIRAWAVRDLGPGSYKDTTRSVFPNKTADIRIETNIEYRFKLVSKLEGALFIDAGNIWAINRYDDRKGAKFAFNRFYNEIAIGAGAGLRLDVSFFIFRLDLGFKVRNPAYAADKRWVFNQSVTWNEHFNPVIGINYPF